MNCLSVWTSDLKVKIIKLGDFLAIFNIIIYGNISKLVFTSIQLTIIQYGAVPAIKEWSKLVIFRQDIIRHMNNQEAVQLNLKSLQEDVQWLSRNGPGW